MIIFHYETHGLGMIPCTPQHGTEVPDGFQRESSISIWDHEPTIRGETLKRLLFQANLMGSNGIIIGFNGVAYFILR